MRPLKFRFWLKNVKQGILELKQGSILDMAWNWDKADQFTGLLDRHGKEIYEGDIVVFRDNRTILQLEPHDSYSEVCFGEYNYGDYENQESGYGWYERGITDDDGMGLDSTFTKKYLEVIGNIYENPGLLIGKGKR